MIQTSESAGGKEASPVNKLAKDNHSLQKTAWNNRDSNYYLFDYKSRTASQLYEMNLTLDPKKMAMTEQMEAEGEKAEEDTFSFFTPDGLVRTDSELTVNAEGKITLKDSEANNAANEGGGLRKRSLDDVNNRLEVDKTAAEENIEYVGLVKRPKTPLITSRDIEAQAAVLSERKQSGCGSLPDVISSSVETTELHASRSVPCVHYCGDVIVRNDDGVVTPGDGVGGRFRPDSDHSVHTMHMVTWAITRMGISS